MKMKNIIFKKGVPDDPEGIIDFWKRNSITLSKTDTPDGVRSAASLYPDLFIVAFIAADAPETGNTPFDDPGSVQPEKPVPVGTVWGTFDGRRGYIVHLAVETQLRGQGIGRRLMHMVEEEFNRLGCYKVHLFVEQHNQSVGEFYRKIGYQERSDLTVFSRTL